jgi:hypothetical protein
MFRTADLKVHKPMFAVNLDAWSVDAWSVGDKGGDGSAVVARNGNVAAVWFRRKRGVLAACGGYLGRWLVAGTYPADAQDFLMRPAMYDHIASCVARWDGSTLWSLEPEESREEYKRLLVPMLAAYPAIPDGYDGWWWNG